MRVVPGSLLLLLVLALRAMSAEPASPAAPPHDHAERMTRGTKRFREQVGPLLTKHCVRCHGGDATKGELDLTTRAGLLRGGTDGPVVTLYDSATSRLVRLVRHEGDPHMPSKGDRLPEEDIRQFAEWIDDGAPYDPAWTNADHRESPDRAAVTEKDRTWWSFQPLGLGTPPAVARKDWARTPVDLFIQAGLEARGLVPAPEADRRTLLRRASLDVLGIPPSPEALDSFLKDSSGDAWARQISRLLDQPGYGERWARHWLDVARFAESSGFEHDYDRPGAYHYRDFVIRALNEDLPYDQFVRWQIAGDEFEPDSPLALMATGFLGAGVFPTQITANEVERTRYDALDDMLATTGSAFLGLTVGCARCHDHKFDPIPTRDYYRMLATFTSTVRSDLELDLDPEATRRARNAFEAGHAPREKALADYERTELPRRMDQWLSQGAPAPNLAWETLLPKELVSKSGATFEALDDGSFRATGKNGDTDQYTFTAEIRGESVRSLRVEALADPSLPHGGPGRADNGNFALGRIRILTTPSAGGDPREVPIARARATFEQNSGNLSVASTLDDQPNTGWAVDPRFGTNHAAVFELAAPLDPGTGARISIVLEFGVNTRHSIGRLRLATSGREHPDLDGLALPPRIASLLAELRGGNGSGLSAADRAALLDWWKWTDAGWRELQGRVAENLQAAPRPKLTRVLVCAEGYPALRMHTQGADFFPETHFLQRGSPDLKQGVATPGFLQVLSGKDTPESRWAWQPPQGARYSGRRRALATWMTDVDRGAGTLLARVIVNRIWQHHFGVGLVATPNDFGAQGAKPTNPALLDWLAGELIRGGWRLKPIHQLILSSATYRQSSRASMGTSTPAPTDPLLGCWTPRRLEAEAVRDTLLSVSGALDPTRFGPGTRDPNSTRRSIYFTVKRSELTPVLQTFDAPEPLVSQGARPTTTVAPQALFLMNSPQVRAWSARFAERMDPNPAEPLESPVVRAYGLALNRTPRPAELADAMAFVQEQSDRHRRAGTADPRHSALTDFAQVVLSLDELIYVE